MRFMIFIILLMTCSIGHSQAIGKETIFKDLSQGKLMKLTIKVASYDTNKITKFSLALARYKGKIFNVEFNTDKQIVKFTYNEFMLKQDLIAVFDEYGINYKPEKDRNIKTVN